LDFAAIPLCLPCSGKTLAAACATIWETGNAASRVTSGTASDATGRPGEFLVRRQRLYVLADR